MKTSYYLIYSLNKKNAAILLSSLYSQKSIYRIYYNIEYKLLKIESEKKIKKELDMACDIIHSQYKKVNLRNIKNFDTIIWSYK